MSHVKKISFDHVDRKHACTCDRCGQGIINIWSVEYAEGFTVHYGIDCWEKVYKGGKLSQYGEKEIKKIMKSIKGYEDMRRQWESGEITEETCYAYKEAQNDKLSPWFEKTFEEYKKWILEELIPYRLEITQKELEKFKKVDFAD